MDTWESSLADSEPEAAEPAGVAAAQDPDEAAVVDPTPTDPAGVDAPVDPGEAAAEAVTELLGAALTVADLADP